MDATSIKPDRLAGDGPFAESAASTSAETESCPPAGDVMTNARPCDCGSGHPSQWAYDARGIELAKVCPKCEAAKLARFRPEVLCDASYEMDEPVDPDEPT